MATRTTHVRYLRQPTYLRLVASFAALATAVGLVVAVSPTATAEPRPTIEQVEAQVEALQNDAASASELANDADIRLAATQVKISALKVKLAAARIKVGQASASIDAMARTAYTSGGSDAMMQAMLADDPTQFLDRAATLDAVARSSNTDLRRSQAARIVLAQVQTELSQQQVAALAVAKEASEHRTYIDSKLTEAQRVLGQLKQEERERLAALQEARRQAAIKAAAVIRAQQEAEARAAAKAAAEREAAAKAQRDRDNARPPRQPGTPAPPSAGSSGGGSSTTPDDGGGSSSGDPSTRARAAVQYALAQVGEPYSYSARPPTSWDCSKLTAAAWRSAGVSLTAYSFSQFSQTRRISRSELRPGDLLFYFGGGAHHVSMYIGGGRMVHAANPSRGVEVTDAWGSWYASRYSGAGRVL